MKLTALMASLMPTFTKGTLEDEFEEVQKIVNQINIPFLEAGVKQLGKYKFKTEFVDTMETQLVDSAKVKKFPNFLGSFLEINKRMRDQFPVIQRLIDEYFEEDISVHALNLQRVNLLQYIPIMMFIARYIRTFTNYALGLEINIASESPEATFELIPAERDWLKANRSTFLDSVNVVMHRGDKLEKIFEQLPDMGIDPSNAKIVEQTQGLKADPMGLGFIPLSVNPFFWAGKFLVNYQTERYHLAKDELDMLERKLYNLKIINDGRNDAKLQKEIKYLEENRVKPLKEKIMNWEEEYVHNS